MTVMRVVIAWRRARARWRLITVEKWHCCERESGLEICEGKVKAHNGRKG